MRVGRYAQAEETLLAALQNFGPHVGLLADLAGTAYLRGDVGMFLLRVERLECDFRTSYSVLSEKSKLLTHVTLAKYCEELGRVHEAFEHTDRALRLASEGDVQAVRVRCLKLRLLASFGKEAELSSLYRQCQVTSKNFPQLRVETQQALLLAEARIFGLSSAILRFQDLTAEEALQAADLRLSAIDLLEIAIETADILAMGELKRLIEPYKTELDAYENAVLSLAENGENAVSEASLLRWSGSVTSYAYLRLLALTIVVVKNVEQRSKQKARFLFQLRSYDRKTQEVLMKKWQALATMDSNHSLELDSKNRVVRSDGRSLSFQKSPLSWTLLCEIGKGKLNPDDLLTGIGNQPGSIENMETLRISILRLNKKISALAGVDWIVRLRKDGVAVNPRVSFELC
jgi:tetratricopeptide (TPR) repeat protein